MPPEITVHPFGEIERSLVECVRAAVEDRFKKKATVGQQLKVPKSAYSAARRQYRSTKLLRQLTEIRANGKPIRLGIAAVDLFVPALNFVFGEASIADQVAVFSTTRLDPAAWGDPTNTPLLVRRATIEAVHELGHVFGLDHCRRPNCVMWFSNTLAETDRKGSQFCEDCAHQLGLSSTRGKGASSA